MKEGKKKTGFLFYKEAPGDMPTSEIITNRIALIIVYDQLEKVKG